MDVIYDGIRLHPAQLVETAIEQNPHAIGLSILSGSHVSLVRDFINLLKQAGKGNILKQLGVTKVYTPKNFELNKMMAEIAVVIEKRVAIKPLSSFSVDYQEMNKPHALKH